MDRGYTAAIRLDHLTRLVGRITENEELGEILGEPLDKHFALAVRKGRLKFNPVAPEGEPKRDLTDGQRQRIIEIVDELIKEHRKGAPDMPTLM